ncbi:FAD/NAD(P)-binding protein [Pseudomonas mucidolens]|uniref:FAD/NAD(P)-binding protein n=1 Tax=Pseudomonas mucidolens TaxID=46679 RepID=UPI0030DABD77
MEHTIKKIKIAIVGGGSVGIAYFTQLINEAVRQGLSRHLEVLIFESQKTLGPGYAYQTDFECNLLNTRADAMSAVADDKRHFIRWLEQHGADQAVDFPETIIDDHAFLPRSLFGRYLAHQYEQTMALARANGIQVTPITSTVTDLISLSDQRPCIDTENGVAYVADRVVLSMGNLPSTSFTQLHDTAGFVRTPYPTRAMVRDIPPTASVCVLGTGLSAIDSVLSLVDSGHQGKIVMASRNGRLPSVRGTFNRPHTLTHLTREKIDNFCHANGGLLKLHDVFTMLLREIEDATGTSINLKNIMNSGAGVLEYITSEIVQADNAERLWQSVIYSTNSIIDYVWHRLSRDDKQIFQNTFGSLWSSYRVSVPVKNAHKLQALLKADRILVLGGVSQVTYNEATKVFETRIDDRQNAFRTVIESEYVINATGYSVQVEKSDVPLVLNLLRRKLAIPNEFGGFELDFNTGELVGSAGKTWSNVSVLGSLASGTYFWTNAMDVNVRLARRQVEDVLSSLLDSVQYTSKPLARAPRHRPMARRNRAASVSSSSKIH